MASSDDNMKIVGAKNIDYGSASGNSPTHHEVRAANAYKSKETPGWDKIEAPKSQNYQERKRSGTDVPTPPTLNLP